MATGKFLSKATKGVIEKAPLIMLYGVPGVGKSSLACSAPNAAIIPVEDGSNQINVHLRLPQPTTWNECRDMVQELIDCEHDCKTLVIDTVDALEALLFQKVCLEGKGSTIGKAYDGFGNGYQKAVDTWRELLAQLERLRSQRGMTVLMLAHSTVKPFHDPGGPDYDRYIPKMDQRGWLTLFEQCDAALFAHYENASTSIERDEKGKVLPTGKRVLRCASGAWEAKNRFGFPDVMPMLRENGWSVIDEHLSAPKKIRAEIESLLIGQAPELQAVVRSWLANAGSNSADLRAGLDRVKARIAEAKGGEAKGVESKPETKAEEKKETKKS